MKILITGGAGFIGSNLARYMNRVAPDAEIVVLDDLSTGSLENLSGLSYEFAEGTILDYDLVRNLAQGADSIIHLGAIPSVPRSVANPIASHHANTTGTLNVLEAARNEGVDHVVVASSSAVYGSNPKLPKTEFDWTRPMSPYGVSKHATEGYAIAYAHSYGLKTLAFRFFNVYGPGQAAGHAYAAVIPQFLDAALKGEPLPINGDGTQSRDFTYVDTLCQVLFKAIQEKTHSLHPVNLAFGTNTTLLELIAVIEDLLGRKVDRQFKEARVGDVKASQSDGQIIAELFPDIEIESLRDGVASTIKWFETGKYA